MTRVLIAAPGPDWASIMTAIGTVAVAVVAVGVALFAEWRAGKRVADERAHGDERLREERQIAADEIAEERRLFREREQLAEANAIVVTTGILFYPAGSPGEMVPKRLSVRVDNRSRYTITRLEARVSPDGKSLIVVGPPEEDRDYWVAYGMVVLQWGSDVRFETDDLPISGRQRPVSAVVRWTDRWGTRWEHKKGQVRQIKDGEEWLP